MFLVSFQFKCNLIYLPRQNALSWKVLLLVYASDVKFTYFPNTFLFGSKISFQVIYAYLSHAGNLFTLFRKHWAVVYANKRARALRNKYTMNKTAGKGGTTLNPFTLAILGVPVDVFSLILFKSNREHMFSEVKREERTV